MTLKATASSPTTLQMMDDGSLKKYKMGASESRLTML